jgi:ABC-2 type transport system ATP-binding protein
MDRHRRNWIRQEMVMDAPIRAEGIRKTYGSSVVVDGVSIEVGWGEVVGIVGPNGAGKTTTVECLMGLRRPDGGIVRVLGRDPAVAGNDVRMRVGAQLQRAALPDRIKVREAMTLFASLYPRPLPWRDLIDEWGLGDRAEARFEELSGGERQRLFVALALVGDPEVVFLDEMTTGLDPRARRATWASVEGLRDRERAVVLVTHFLEEAERLCDRVAVMAGGRMVAMGSPSDLVRRELAGSRGRDATLEDVFLTLTAAPRGHEVEDMS